MPEVTRAPSSAVVKNRYSCTSATPICLLGMEGDRITFSSLSVETYHQRHPSIDGRILLHGTGFENTD
jgi:hypothetical protein